MPDPGEQRSGNLRGKGSGKRRGGSNIADLIGGGTSNLGKPRKKTADTVLWKYKSDQTHFVEGHKAELRYKGAKPSEFPKIAGPTMFQNVDSNVGGRRITKLESDSRNKAYNAQQKKWNKEFAMRKKIKPIKDPDSNVSESRRRATRRKGQGRSGTLLSQSDTLG